MISDQLRDELLAFRKARDWEQFHNLRTLFTSIALEAAERGVPRPTSFRRHRPDASGRPCGRASSFGHPALLLDRRLRSSILTRRALAGRTITARAIRSRLAEAPLEHTQWAKDAELPTLATEHRDTLAEEMADIAILLTYLAHDLRVDLETAVRQKLVKNAAKYPVKKAKGVATKWDRL